jgi:hypothetical protein
VRRTRPKLDPRLAHLLSLPRKRLQALKREEHRRLSALSEEPDSIPAASKADRRPGRPLLALTGGVYFPSRETWERGPAAIREPYISAFILADVSGADLVKLGARVRSQACDVFTAFVPLSRIPALEAAPGVRYVELAGTVSTALDQAIPYTGMDVLHRRSGGGDRKDARRPRYSSSHRHRRRARGASAERHRHDRFRCRRYCDHSMPACRAHDRNAGQPASDTAPRNVGAPRRPRGAALRRPTSWWRDVAARGSRKEAEGQTIKPRYKTGGGNGAEPTACAAGPRGRYGFRC